MSFRLEIGCGRKPLRGFKHIDIEAYANPDFLGDFRTMSFSDVEEIQSHHLLEHFGREEAIKVLELWKSWLKVGGKLVVTTPDFEGICEEFGKVKDPKRMYWLCRHAYGSQEADWSYHRNGWWEDKLRSTFESTGFSVLSIRKFVSRGYLPNITVEAIKR